MWNWKCFFCLVVLLIHDRSTTITTLKWPKWSFRLWWLQCTTWSKLTASLGLKSSLGYLDPNGPVRTAKQIIAAEWRLVYLYIQLILMLYVIGLLVTLSDKREAPLCLCLHKKHWNPWYQSPAALSVWSKNFMVQGISGDFYHLHVVSTLKCCGNTELGVKKEELVKLQWFHIASAIG